MPLDHPRREGLVDVLAVFVEAGLVEGDADVVDGPRFAGVTVAFAAHFARLVVLLAFAAHGESLVGELDLNDLRKARRSKGKDVPVRGGLRIHQLL